MDQLSEMFVSVLVSLLIDNLSPLALSFFPSGGSDSKLKEWRNMLVTIEAVLEDAEDRQLTDKSIQLWLRDVQKLAFDIEDFVDDLATEAGRRQMIAAPESSRPSKLRKLISRFNPRAITFNYDMDRKIGEISNSLQQLEKRKNILNLQKSVGGKSERSVDVRLPSTSLVTDVVYGREEDCAAILKWMLLDRTNDEGKLCIMSIVGMGGIGKTTLAQSLYNDERVADCFHDRAWVCVTNEFDVLKLSKIIYEEVCKKSCNFSDLNMVQVKLQEKLSKKKFLIVVDDVWNEDYAKWDVFCAPFRVGAIGSTIIVTTRSRDVAKIVGSKEVYDLKELSDGDCLSVLAKHAFQRPNFNEHQEFREIGEAIAMRCKGIPLAAKSLGGLLRTKGSSKQWVEVSTSKIWELRSNGIIPALRLSYHHLPPYLKPLFAYCSLFPKGYEFSKHELIFLWMAQGFLRRESGGGQKLMEEWGCEYFNELLSRSFFQPSIRNETKFVMHDLNNDLAQFVAGLTSLRLDNKSMSNEQYKVSDEVRHASFISSTYDDSRNFKAFDEARCLRTLLPIQARSWNPFYLKRMVLNNLLPKLPCLRVLSISNYDIHELPNSIGDLKHLRYLNLTGSGITELPQSVCDLYNLQTLLLEHCRNITQLPSNIQRLINLQYLDLSMTSIRELPQSICDLYNLQALLLRRCVKLVQLPSNFQRLINLRHLEIETTPSLEEMPPGIGMLTRLRTLEKFVVSKSNGRKINELKCLHHLQGKLSITGMENVINVQDAKNANLLGKKDVHVLTLKWNNSSSDSGLELKVLDALRPHICLRSLRIEFYGGQKFPGWIGDREYIDMVEVRLVNCKNCVNLPPLGQLTSLKELFIQGMDGVKVVGTDFLGTGSPNNVAFQSLLKLSFRDMGSWEEWSADVPNGAFPCLQEVEMSGCLKLDKVSLQRIPSLELLKVHGCSEIVLRSLTGVGSVKKLEVDDISMLSKLDERIIRCLGKVEDLRVSGCDQLRNLWEEGVACQVLDRLKSLTLIKCEQLECLGDEEQLLPHNIESLTMEYCNKLEKIPNWKNSLTSLRRLEIRDCNLLVQSSSGEKHEFSNLEKISITNCQSLKWLPTGENLPATLRDLRVWSCENLEEIWGKNGMALAFLESIILCNWLNLKSLPQGLANLTRLSIDNCSGIESISETSLSPTLIILEIRHCKNLKYMLCTNEMQSLTSLRELKITICNNLKNYPRAGCWPPNLESLTMGDVKKPITEWGLATLPTSLFNLALVGKFPQLLSFSEKGTQLTSTTTLLRSLQITGLENLECLWEGLENLSSLRQLQIEYCPKFGRLPKILPPALSRLEIIECPIVKERCKKEKRDNWPNLSHIPYIRIDFQSIWEL